MCVLVCGLACLFISYFSIRDPVLFFPNQNSSRLPATPGPKVSVASVFKKHFFWGGDQGYTSLVLICFITLKKILLGNKRYFKHLDITLLLLWFILYL